MPGVEPEMMVVATSRDEERSGHLCHDVKPENAMIKLRGLWNIPHLKMDVPQISTRGQTGPWLSRAIGLGQQAPDVNRVGCHPHLIAVPVPLSAWSVTIDLDAIPIRVRQIQRLADEVVSLTRQRIAQVEEMSEPAAEVRSGGHQNSEVVEASGENRPRPRPGLLGQKEERHPGDAQDRIFPRLLQDSEPHHLGIKLQRAIEVGNGECNGADLSGRVDRVHVLSPRYARDSSSLRSAE